MGRDRCSFAPMEKQLELNENDNEQHQKGSNAGWICHFNLIIDFHRSWRKHTKDTNGGTCRTSTKVYRRQILDTNVLDFIEEMCVGGTTFE